VFGVASDELLDQGAGQAVDVAAPQRAFQAGVGGAAGQRLSASSGARPRQFEQRVMAQGVGVVAVFVAGGHLKDALRQQIAQRMGDIARIARIPDRLGQAIDQADTRSTALSTRAPRSEETSPPVKSARTVKPAAGGNRSCSGVKSRLGECR
jgi:hypothetical protein